MADHSNYSPSSPKQSPSVTTLLAGQPIDCLFIGLLKEHAKPELDFSYEFYNLGSALAEHPRLKTRYFFPDLEVRKHGFAGMRQRFTALLEQAPPDMLIHQPFDAEYDVDGDALRDWTQNGGLSICFDADTSWRFDEWTVPRADRYALFLTTHKASLPKYQQLGVEVMLTQWAVGSWYWQTSVTSSRTKLNPLQTRRYPVSFIGKIHSDRLQQIYALRKSGVSVSVAGLGWSTSRKHQMILNWRRQGQNLGYVDFAKACQIWADSQISLNLTAAPMPGMGNQIKARHFEIPALGACQVSTAADDIADYFVPDEEIVMLADGQELADVVEPLLVNPQRVANIASAGHARVLAEHTWQHRINALLAELGV